MMVMVMVMVMVTAVSSRQPRSWLRRRHQSHLKARNCENMMLLLKLMMSLDQTGTMLHFRAFKSAILKKKFHES